MARIEGSVIRSDGSGTTLRDAHIEYTITSQSIKDNTSTVNVKSYYDIVGGITGYTVNGTSKLRYDGANEVSNAVNFTEGAAGTSHLMSETNYTISHGDSGAAKTVALYAHSTLIPGGIYSYMLVEGNITLPQISNGHKKISGAWKIGFWWKKISGVWRRCVKWKKISGVWKKGV